MRPPVDANNNNEMDHKLIDNVHCAILTLPCPSGMRVQTIEQKDASKG